MTADRPARAAIATDLDATLFVEAGAGSGKTTQLVARLLGLLLSGRARIDEVAAITFTEAAAAELRDRLAGELEVAAAGAAGTTPEQQALAAGALGGLDGAAITTLHGFSRRVLAEHPFAAGLPPVFDVLDQVRSMVAFDERWDELVDDLLADPSTGQAVSWALACGIPLDALRTVARAFDDNWDRVPADPPPAPELPPTGPSAVLGPLRQALALAGACTDPEDRLLAHLLDLTPAAERLQDAAGRGDLDALGVLATSMGQLAGGSRGRAASWDGRKPEVLELLAVAQQARDETVTGAATAVLARLVTAIGRHARRTADQRRREGRLAFHDLLVLARDLVRDDPAVREALHRQYRYLLVDEFQDTDPIQAELATRIAAGGPLGNGPWATLRVPPGRLFFVGDPQQSIYRFRRADLELFGQVRTELAGRVLELTTNFRSVPGIVDWVDDAFGRLFDGDRSGPRALAARPVHPDPGPPVRVLGVGLDPAPTAEQARQREADDIAAAVLAVRDEGWPVDDEGRAARLADITILVPTRRSVPALQEALDTAGVPYRLESSSLVYSAPEVQDLLAIVRAVDDPTDEPAVVAALRSSGFGCGDDDLVRFRAAGGRWDFRADPPPALLADDPVVDGLQALRDLHADRWWCEVSELVGRVVDDRRLLPLALDDPRWREAWRRLRFVVDQARQFTDAVPGDLRRFLAWVDLQQADDAKVTEVVLPESDVDAVRIMTVHAAKGLEFPVVVLAGTGSEPRRSTGPAVLFGPRGPELGIRTGLSTPGYPALAEQEARLDAEEQVRLLYVAATRARDHLVVSTHRSIRAVNSLAARLVEVVDDRLWRSFEGSTRPAAVGTVPVLPTTPADGPAAPAALSGPVALPMPAPVPMPVPTAADRASWLRRRSLRFQVPPMTVAATGVAKLASARNRPAEEPTIGAGEEGPDRTDRPAGGRGRAGTAVGRAVHATLQVVDLATGEGLAELARREALAEGVGHRAGEVARLVESALGAEVVRAAVAGGRYWRELYVGVPVGGRVLEGIVDLLVDGPDGLEVVDYKTDQGAEELATGYRLQGAAYAVAVESALGRPVARCTFLYLRPHAAIVRRVEDLQEARAEVRRLLQEPDSAVEQAVS